MITFIAIPKPFNGHIGIIQENAIRSWTFLEPKPEIILMGDDEGMKEMAEKFNLCYIPEIEKNEYGTPLYNSIFKEAERLAKYDWLCYINSDVILTSDFITACQDLRGRFPKFLAIARRWNVEISELIDFSDKDWEEKLKEKVKLSGKREGHTGSDIFLFSKDTYKEIPDFTLGRAVFDNWLIYHTRKNNIPVVDMGDMATVVHQYHDYNHHAAGQKGIYTGVEAKRNLALAGGYPHLFTIRDADYQLKPGGLFRKKDSLFSVYRWLVTDSGFYWLFSPLIKLLRFVRTRLSFYRK